VQIKPLSGLIFSIDTTMFAKATSLLLDLTAITAFAPTLRGNPCPTTLPSTTEWSHEPLNITAHLESAALEGALISSLAPTPLTSEASAY
jgi:hypothetical protein